MEYRCPLCDSVMDEENQSSEECMNDDICEDCEGDIYTLNRI